MLHGLEELRSKQTVSESRHFHHGALVFVSLTILVSHRLPFMIVKWELSRVQPIHEDID
jgi:hypothetical protein